MIGKAGVEEVCGSGSGNLQADPQKPQDSLQPSSGETAAPLFGDSSPSPGSPARSGVEVAPDEEPEPSGEAGGEAEAAGEVALDKEGLARRLAELEALLSLKDEETGEVSRRLERMQADYANLRRRSQKEVEDALKYGAERLLVTFLPVLDDLERALETARPAGQAGGAVAAFVDGLEMVTRQFFKVLADEGVAPIGAVGEKFDPQRHFAVARVENSEHPDNVVVEELQRGYLLRDKVLRPSMVKVAVGPAPPSEPDEDPGGSS